MGASFAHSTRWVSGVYDHRSRSAPVHRGPFRSFLGPWTWSVGHPSPLTTGLIRTSLPTPRTPETPRRPVRASPVWVVDPHTRSVWITPVPACRRTHPDPPATRRRSPSSRPAHTFLVLTLRPLYPWSPMGLTPGLPRPVEVSPSSIPPFGP